jgi:hypothetical protein
MASSYNARSWTFTFDPSDLPEEAYHTASVGARQEGGAVPDDMAPLAALVFESGHLAQRDNAKQTFGAFSDRIVMAIEMAEQIAEWLFETR